MAKENKKKAPQVEAPTVEAPATEEAQVVDVNAERKKLPGMPDSMSQHDKVLYTSVIQHRKDEMLRTGGEDGEKYEALTMIEDAMLIDVALTEAIVKRNPAGLILCTNEKNWNMIRLLGNEMGVTLPEFKALPKPTKQQLAAAGITAAPGQVMLQIEDKQVSNETKKKVKAAAKLNEEATSGKKEYLIDHTKIENDDQLKEALEFQLVNLKVTSPLDRLITTAKFYRAYLEARADKADDKDAELARIKELTIADLLQEISQFASASFTAQGFGQLLCKQISTHQSVIPAFELLKRCGKNRKTGVFKFSDEEIAAMLRVLVVWKTTAQIASISAELKRLSKDAEKNKAAIEQANAEIAAEQALMAYVSEPSYDVVDNLIAAYNDKNDETHNTAKAIVASIIETHYKGIEIPELEFETFLSNIQQRAGAVLNLFNSPVGQRDDYSEDNLNAADWEEKPAEEEGKNSLRPLRRKLHPLWTKCWITYSYNGNKYYQSMKRLTTCICCVAFMIAGALLALRDFTMPGNQTALAQPPPLVWSVDGKLPLDLKLDLDKRLSAENPVNVRDSVVLRDSVVVKTKWKTRYKTIAARTTAREAGEHPAAVTPDSMSVKPALLSASGREEQPDETVGTSKAPSIQLTVDGQIVYDSENDNHSAEGSQ